MGSSSENSSNLAQVEIVLEEKSWEKQIKDLQAFCDAICNKVLNGFDVQNPVIAILFTNDEKMQSLNKLWRNIDKPTNVLSFPNIDTDFVLGDIALGYEYCENEAKLQNKSFENHLTHLIIHGVLHLLGYDHIDENEAEEMESLEKEILATLGISDPYILPEDGTIK